MATLDLDPLTEMTIWPPLPDFFRELKVTELRPCRSPTLILGMGAPFTDAPE